jgi:hypothetical protein
MYYIAIWAVLSVVFPGLSAAFVFRQRPLIAGMMLGSALIAALNMVVIIT